MPMDIMVIKCSRSFVFTLHRGKTSICWSGTVDNGAWSHSRHYQVDCTLIFLFVYYCMPAILNPPACRDSPNSPWFVFECLCASLILFGCLLRRLLLLLRHLLILILLIWIQCQALFKFSMIIDFLSLSPQLQVVSLRHSFVFLAEPHHHRATPDEPTHPCRSRWQHFSFALSAWIQRRQRQQQQKQ